MSNNFIKGNHLVICDICGNEVYSNECSKTWNGFIACRKFNCYDEKHPIDMPRPVIADPFPVHDVRADIPDADHPEIEDTFVSTWNHIVNRAAVGGRIQWQILHKKWGGVDDPDEFI